MLPPHMRETVRRGLLLLLVAATAAGCASPGSIPVTQSQYLADEDFGAYRRYAWLPTNAEDRRRTQPDEHRLHDRIKAALDRTLISRGFVRGREEDADFLVTYYCRVAEQLKPVVIDRVLDDPGGDWEERVTPRIELHSFEEGSIVIDFVNARSGKRAWRGFAQGAISPDATPEELDEIVDHSVRQILEEFPPP